MNGSEYDQIPCTKFSKISKKYFKILYRLLLTFLQTGIIISRDYSLWKKSDVLKINFVENARSLSLLYSYNCLWK